MTFSYHYNELVLERACAMYSDIVKTDEWEKGNRWQMTAHFWNNTHEVELTKTFDDWYLYSNKDGNFICRFDGDDITIKEGEYHGRKCKADKTLKKFSNTAMLLFSLVKSGKLL